MKAILKKIKGSTKVVASIMPFVAFLGTVGAFIGLTAHGYSKIQNTFEEVRETPEFKQMIDSDSALLKDKLDIQEMTMQEYQERMEYWNSKDSVLTYLNTNSEPNKQYIHSIKSGDDMVTAGGVLTAFAIVGSAVGTAFYIADGFSKILESGKDDIQLSKEINEREKKLKELKKLDKEYDEYKEEIYES